MGRMDIKVRLYSGGVYISPTEYDKYQIKSNSIDRIVNDVVKRASCKQKNTPSLKLEKQKRIGSEN